MPKGLKQTSSPIQISTSSQLTTDILVPQFVSKRVDLQLNPLDNEVFVVTGLKIDFEDATPVIDATATGTFQRYQKASVSTTQQLAFAGIESPSTIGAQLLSYYVNNVTGDDHLSVIQSDAMDAPPASMDYLQIIATNDFWVNYAIDNGFFAGQNVNIAVRVYGYRAVADASTYASLVQSELLSS